MRSITGLLGRIWSVARLQFSGAILLAILLSSTEGISLAIAFPLIALLGDSNPSAHPAGPSTQLLFHWLTALGVPRSLWLAVTLILVIVGVGLLAQLNELLQITNIFLALRLRKALSTEVLDAILHADWVFLTRRRSSDLTHLLTEQMLRLGTACNAITACLANGLVAIVMIAVAAWLAPALTGAVLLVFTLLLVWQRRILTRMYATGEAISVRWAAVFESVAGRIQNLKVVKAFGAERSELALFAQRYDDGARELIASEWHTQRAARGFQLLLLVLLCGFILVGSGPLRLPSATLLVFLFAFMRATPRLQALQSSIARLTAQLPAYRSIVDFLAECRENAEMDASDRLQQAAPALRRELTLHGVSFSYKSSTESRAVLDNLDLALPAGCITALSGASGEGKSTVADLIMGLLVPESGSITVDGEPITRANARSWRSRIGYVSQDTVLFHGSIRSNLLWAQPNATDAQLQQALAAASAEFVFTLEAGLETVVGDRGLTLSHGQRQRLALARALLLEPELLILDEATNSLDLESEEKILGIIQAYGTRVTTLLISHRPSALKVAARVLTLERGRIRDEASQPPEEPAFEGVTRKPLT